MNDRVPGYLLLGLSLLIYLLAGAAFVAVLRALTVSTTLAAVETAFGSLVLCILLLVLARKAWDSGKKHIGTKA